MKKIIILMGVPGSGKGTQAQVLASDFGYAHISTGDLLRALAANPEANEEEKEMLAAMQDGKLVSDKLIYTLAFREMEKNFSEGKGVVLDGAIRNLEQAEKYQEFFKKQKMDNQVIVIDVHISDKVSLERLLHRKSTSSVARADDDPEIMKKRILAQGNTAIKPILDYYEKLEVLKTVDGEKSIPEVTEEIKEVLKD